MSTVHVVKAGECLSSLAAHYGLSSHRTIYDHPDNEEFREIRPDPNIIHPGDRVAIPDLEMKSVPLETNQIHRIRVHKSTVLLRLKLELDRPDLVSADYELHVDGRSEPFIGSLDSGQLEQEISARATRVHLHLLHPKGGTMRTFEIHVGHLDPPDTDTGVQARLRRLGYACGDADGIIGPRTRAALRAFRAAHGIEDSERPFGNSTRQALVDELGH